MKAMIYGAGGGTSSDEVTALKKYVLSPYTTITNDSGDEIVAGTMVDNGAVNRSLKCGESYTIVEGFHNGSGVISADSLASQTGADAAAGDILTGKTAWVNGIKLTGTLPTMAGGTKTPSTSQITVACSGYKMTSNIVIPAFSLPTASKLLKGYTYTIYGKSVTGTAQQYLNTNNSNFVTSGFDFNNISGTVTKSNGSIEIYDGIAMYTKVINPSGWLYLKAKCNSDRPIQVGIANNANNSNVVYGSNAVTSILSIKGYSGPYFIYIKNSSTKILEIMIKDIYLSNT